MTIEATSEQRTVVQNVVDAYCVDCPEDTLENDSVCESCHIRRMMDALIVPSETVVSVRELVRTAMKLETNRNIPFAVRNANVSEDEIISHNIGLITFGESFCLVLNCQGGGNAYIIDVTQYDSSLNETIDVVEQYLYSSYETGLCTSVAIQCTVLPDEPMPSFRYLVTKQ